MPRYPVLRWLWLCLLLVTCTAVARCDRPTGPHCGDGRCDGDETAQSCTADCYAISCGDGLCADGESVGSCPVDCFCGNGTCDEDESMLLCPSECSVAVCGNNACEPTETMSSCPGDCTTAVCGNGDCEATETMLSCPNDCTTAVCGNGDCEPGEETYGCGTDCPSTCGNGLLEAGEQCDGTVAGGLSCSTETGHLDGTLSCNSSCQISTVSCHTCGNGLREQVEECDGAELGGVSCVSLGHTAGTLACDSACQLDESVCADCGNGILEPPELCDGADLGSPTATCVTAGHSGGVLQCLPGCAQHDASGCFNCGDAICESALGESSVNCPADCGWTAVSAGGKLTCGIRVDGTAWCWGRGTSGQLGDGNSANSSTPVQVQGLANVTDIAAGFDRHACALTGGPAPLLYCWGWNGFGQLGDGTTTSHSTPVQVTNHSHYTSIAAGADLNCATTTSGAVWCWGHDSAALGTCSFDAPEWCEYSPGNYLSCSKTPLQVVGLSNATEVVGQQDAMCARQSSGTVECWGDNYSDQYNQVVGYRCASPTPNVTQAAGIGPGPSHGCMIHTDGTAWCWGTNYVGQCGNGSMISGSETPTQVASITNVVSINGGGYSSWSAYTCAADANGDAYCWGDNAEGQLGDGTVSTRYTPALVTGLAGAEQVSAGDYHSCAVNTAAEIWCWGLNDFGQLGNSTTTNVLTPVRVAN